MGSGKKQEETSSSDEKMESNIEEKNDKKRARPRKSTCKKNGKIKNSIESTDDEESEPSTSQGKLNQVNGHSNKRIRKPNRKFDDFEINKSLIKTEGESDVKIEINVDDEKNSSKGKRNIKNKKKNEIDDEVIGKMPTNCRKSKRKLAPNNDDDDDDDEESNVSTKKVKTSSKKCIKKKETPKVESVNVTCGKCQEEMLKKSWPSHNLQKHNNMAWLEGSENPNYENNEKEWRSMLFVVIKKKNNKLNCDKCNKVIKSVFGFISHYGFCGKSKEEQQALRWICPKCRGSFKPSSRDVHERIHRENERQNELLMNIDNNKDIINIENETIELKRKRKAAECANNKILEFTKLVEDTDKSPPKKKAKVKLKELIDKPQQLKKIPSIYISNWKKAIESSQDAKCRQPGCNFSSNSFDSICQHHYKCDFQPKTAYICKICKHLSVEHSEMEDHIKNTHPERVDSDDSDYKTTDSSDLSSDEDYHDNDDDTDDEDDGDDNDGNDIDGDNGKEKKRKKKKKRKRNKAKRRKVKIKMINNYEEYGQFLSKEQTDFKNHFNMAYPPAYHWTLKFQSKHFQTLLYQDLIPNEFQFLTTSNAEQYLPELKLSMQFKKEKFSLKNDIKIDNKNKNWKQLNLFESTIDDNIPTFFVGGPVWSIAFLPISASLYLKKPDQFIAISTHPSMESNYKIGNSYKFKNILQIWNLGHLSNDLHFKPILPKLSYAVAHEKGTIWAMEWCPSGVYQNNSIINELKLKNRMGLLATACSDGCIYIYSLPFPEDISQSTNDNLQYPIYKTDPVITLCVNKYLLDNDKIDWQCLTLNWSKINGHEIIAGGFTNGYVALWDLNTKSPLLKVKIKNTIFINSFKHFFAHKQAVSFVGIMPFIGERYLVTCSLDRLSKIWDLEDTSNEIECTKRGVAVNGSLISHWPGFIVSYDDALSLQHTVTYFHGLRELNQKTFSMIPTNSTTYGLAVSDYTNGICHGSLAGDVFSIFPLQLFYLKDLETLTRRRWLISSSKIIDFHNKNETTQTASNDNDQSKTKEYIYMPDTYNDCKDRFGIIFTDDLNNTRYINGKISEKKNPFNSNVIKSWPVEQYPFTSVNRISWNCNQWSCLWLAAGYQNGFIRLIHLKSLGTSK